MRTTHLQVYKKITPHRVTFMSWNSREVQRTACSSHRWLVLFLYMCVPGTKLRVSVLAALPLPTVSPAPRATNSCARLSFFPSIQLKEWCCPFRVVLSRIQYNQDNAPQASPEPNCNLSNPSWVCLLVHLLEILDQVDSSNPFPIVNVPLYTIPTPARPEGSSFSTCLPAWLFFPFCW